MNDPYSRACLRWFKDCVIRMPRRPTVFPDLALSGYERLNGRNYVVLRAPDGAPLRIYQIRKNGLLRKVIPWPATFSIPPKGFRKDDDMLYYRLAKNPLEK